jgi:hypothetical protein
MSAPSANDIVPVTNTEDNVTFFKKRSTSKNIRKRKTPVKVKSDSDDDDDSDDDAVVSEVVTKDRKTGINPFVQGTRRRRVKKNEEGDDESETEDLIGVQYTADRSATVKKSDATRYDTAWELEKNELDKKKNDAPKKDVMNAKMSVGPQRAPANLRVTQRFDYQPDICKDYKGIVMNLCKRLGKITNKYYGQKLASVAMAILVFSCTTVVITRLDGSLKKSGKMLKRTKLVLENQILTNMLFQMMIQTMSCLLLA